jgi:hypothetical protein
MVLARVPKERIREQAAYEYFVATTAAGQPTWSKDIAARGAVFTFPGNCYRGGVTYNAALKRYFWCQILPHSTHPQGMRFQGGFGIYACAFRAASASTTRRNHGGRGRRRFTPTRGTSGRARAVVCPQNG